VIRSIIFGLLLWATTIYVLWRGEREERIAVVGMFLNAYGTLLVVSPLATRFSNFETWVILVDAIFTAVLVWMALSSQKFWPLWLAAMQALATLAHFAPFVPHIIPWGYGSAVAIWSYPMLIVLFVVTRLTYRQRYRAPR
jgi:hypothetical protein